MSLELVEIECPYSLRYTDCLKKENGVLSLKNITCLLLSMQLAVAGLRWCDFVVWTSVGSPSVVRVYFNQEFWVPVEKKLLTFYQDVYSPEYFGMRLPRDIVALDFGDIKSVFDNLSAFQLSLAWTCYHTDCNTRTYIYIYTYIHIYLIYIYNTAGRNESNIGLYNMWQNGIFSAYYSVKKLSMNILYLLFLKSDGMKHVIG